MSTSASGNYGIIATTAVGGVSLKDKFIDHQGSGLTRTAGIRINANGTVQWLRTFQELALEPLTDWIIPNSSASSSYEVRITNLTWVTKDEGFIISPSGTDTYTIPMNLSADGDSDGDEDTWFDLGTSREWVFLDEDTAETTGLQSATFDMQIRIGSTVLATAAMNWTVDSSSGGGGGCFVYGQQFRMVDGSLKEVQDIMPGDIMEAGGKVYQAIVGDGNAEEWYDVNGIAVTGHHGIFKDGVWMRVRNAGYNLVQGADIYYVVANERHKMITENGQMFGDFQEVDYMSTGWDDWVIEKLNGRSDDDAIREAIKATALQN